MIHPQYWSLHSIYLKLKGRFPEALGRDDLDLYAQLPVKDKVVLDIGAYDGDTAEFFLKRGANKVICIEPDEGRCSAIRRRFPSNRVEVRCRGVSKEDVLARDYDVIKCDCEGYEMEILDYIPKGVPVVLESHCWWITKQFEEKGFKIYKVIEPMLRLCLMKNF